MPQVYKTLSNKPSHRALSIDLNSERLDTQGSYDIMKNQFLNQTIVERTRTKPSKTPMAMYSTIADGIM
jgi:hypothetical protein